MASPSFPRMILLAALFGFVGAWPAETAGAVEMTAVSAVTSVPGLDGARAAALKAGGIRSLFALSHAAPAEVARLLSIGTGEARRIIRAARARQAALQRSYVDAKALLRLPPVLPGERALTPDEESFATLVGPINECTLLVRKACGVDDFCDNAPQCDEAKSLLEGYNAGPNVPGGGEPCLVRLADDRRFPICAGD